MRILLFISLFLIPFFHKAQTHRFVVEVGGKQVGELIASQLIKDDDLVIHVKSDANVKLLWKSYGRRTYFMNHFQGKKLMKSHAISYYNDQLEDSVIVISNHKDYSGYQHPDKRMTIPEKEIKVTTSNLFFTEPLNADSVYSERFLQFCKLSRSGNGKYELHLPDGTINNYTYTNNQLEEILIDRPWVNLKIRKQ
jgi:hypothetical protein